MNDRSEMWNVRWHALQKDLAKAFTLETNAQSAALLAAVVQGPAMVAPSWLGRPRRRVFLPSLESRHETATV